MLSTTLFGLCVMNSIIWARKEEHVEKVIVAQLDIDDVLLLANTLEGTHV